MDVIDIGNILRHKSVKSKKKINVYCQSNLTYLYHTYYNLLFASFTDFFLYSHTTDFIQGLLKKNKKKLPDPLISRSAIQMISFY
jgi:hypothetical protein